jgi:hypothetical protein
MTPIGLYWQSSTGRSRASANEPYFALREWNGDAALAPPVPGLSPSMGGSGRANAMVYNVIHGQ